MENDKEIKNIKENLKKVRLIKANIAIQNIGKIQKKVNNNQNEITYKEYCELKDYENDLKECLAELFEDDKNIK